MVRKRKSWREATIIGRLDPNHWRAEYPGGGSGMFREADIRAYDAERDYKVTGSNSYSKMVVRYRRDLLAVHAASEAPQ